MLTPRTVSTSPASQHGMVLLIAMVMLIALSLAGITLIRSVYTTNLVAGNLAYQQSATHAADIAIEKAVKWLQDNPNSLLQSHMPDEGTNDDIAYVAIAQNPGVGQTWEAFWNDVLAPAGVVNSGGTDDAGNQIEFVVHRLCKNVGSTTDGIGCASAPSKYSMKGSSKDVERVALLYSGQVYYRITVRIAGPRQTVSFVQAIVAL